MGQLLKLLFVTLFVGGYFFAPVLLVWGWVRWVRSPRQQTSWSILSLLSFAFATASVFCAVSLFVYSRSLGGGLEHFNDPLFMKMFNCGKLLSQIGIVLGIGGMWRPSLLRWHAPACALATLMFWILTGGD
jgi:hypothetical protein